MAIMEIDFMKDLHKLISFEASEMAIQPRLKIYVVG
jgi:hypothetical protein